jgi:putative hydrolase of the HAD superfamily
MNTALPRAILFDLDDTILSAYGPPGSAWTRITEEFATHFAPVAPTTVAAAIDAHSKLFWSDQARHKYWRFRLHEARREVLRGAFDTLARNGHPISATEIIKAMADRFSALREAEMHIFPGACETLDRLKQLGVRLALVTNGAAEPQRAKVTRFALEHRFDHIQIEGEHGFGKPEERAYVHALAALDAAPSDAWMVGDNLEWEVAAPQRLGIFAIWLDAYNVGLPAGSPIRPDRIIQSLPELL